MRGSSRRGSVATLVALALFWTAGSSGLSAQHPAADGTLTLDEALELARQHNPDYRQARNDLELSGPAHRAAWGAFLPDLSLSVGTGLNFNRRLTAFDNFGNPIENPVAEWRTASNSYQSVSAGVTLFDGGRRFHELDRVGAQADVRAAAARLSLATARAEVERQYFQTLMQLDLREVEEGLLAGRRQDHESTRRLFELASASRVDVLGAELDVQRQERALQQVSREYEKALLALRTAVGDTELEGFDVQGPAPEPFDPADLEGEALVERALAGNPRVLQQEAQVRVSRAGARSARGGRWPSLSLSTNFNQSANLSETDAFLDPFPDASRYASTSLTLQIPAFSRFQTSSEIAQAEVEVRNALETLRQTRLQVEEDLRSQLIDLESAHETYRTALRSQEIAEERLRLAREAYRLASRTFAELQDAVTAAADERRQVIQALYDFHQARITLEETVGISLEEIMNEGG